MRKFTSIFLFLLLLLQFPLYSLASMKLVYDGKSHTYDAKPIYLFINGTEIKPDVPPLIFGGITVVPARAVFEKMGAKVTWDSSAKKVYVKSGSQNIILKINDPMVEVNGVKQNAGYPAKIINGSTMIPLRFVSEKLDMDVKWDSITRHININEKPKKDIRIDKVSVSRDAGKVIVKIEADGPINKYDKIELFKEKPYRIAIDILDSVINTEQCNLSVDDIVLQRIRGAQNNVSPNISRIVLDLAQITDYELDVSEDRRFIFVKIESEGSSDAGQQPVDEVDENDNEDENENVTITLGEEDDFEELNENIGFDDAVKLSREDGNTVVSIKIENENSFKVSRTPDGNAIAVDTDSTSFKNVNYEIPVSDKMVKYLRLQKNDDGAGKIVIGMSKQLQYRVYQEPSGLTILLSNPEYKNVMYVNSSRKSSIIISGDVKNTISIEENKEKNRTVFVIPEGEIDLGDGDLQINDEIVSSLTVATNSSREAVIIVNFNFNGDISYDISNDDNNNTIIDIYKEDNNLPAGKYLVVIDAGHGGKDPGANYNNQVKEKDLNLSIAKKLNKLLQDAGIETIMTRDTDVFVDLYKRANIANDAKADLFVCIHNNWLGNPSYSGTMTLYNPSSDTTNGLTNKEFAQIVQNELLKQLGSTDRKIIPRTDLAVLNTTEMPTILAEIGFISNKEERNKLVTDEYQNKAAKGLLNGVLKALDEIKDN